MLMSLFLCVLSTTATNQEPNVGRAGDPMVITAGNDVGWQVLSPEEAMKAFQETGELRCGPERAQAHWRAHGHLYAEHGVTAFEPYVKWMLMEPQEGTWDPSFYDAELTLFKEHGLRWVPFLIAGPAYATPPWFKESDESVFAVDLATGNVARDQSIWNPYLKPRVRSWLERFFQHYDHQDIQAALLGISGVFGESIYTAGGNIWTQIWDGAYPQHLGWWCGDSHAAIDFQSNLQAKYGKIQRLNKAWQRQYKSFDAIKPFVPDKDHSPRARLDFIQWYMGAMTDFSEWWIATVREVAPTVPILLCTGGSAQPELGADMSAQTKLAARHRAGIRITNEASDYTTNFFITRIIASASLHYGTYFGYEPAGPVDENGIVARIYNAVASGAWELFHYDNPPQGERGLRYKANLEFLTLREPIVPVAFFWSRVSVNLGEAPGLHHACKQLREVCDIAFVDELLIEDGALSDRLILVWPEGRVTEESTVRKIEEAVRQGMVLIVPDPWNPISPEGRSLFPSGHGDQALGKGWIVHAKTSNTPNRPKALAETLQQVLRSDAYGLPEDACLHALASDTPGVFLSATQSDWLFLNHTAESHTLSHPQGTVTLPPHSMISADFP